MAGLLRVVYLVWLCPYQLVADEAQYWDWSRRFEWSYCTKGPGVAWAIAASTALFGNAEWAVRLPVAVAWAVAALAVGRLAAECSEGDGRLCWRAALAFALVPAYIAAGQLMTIDGPLIACWALALWAAWRITNSGDSWAAWWGLAAALGVGFLFTYTMLLLVPGLAVFWLIARRRVGWDRTARAPALTALVVFLVVISPVFIWNHSHGWPTLVHLLRHVGVREAVAAAAPGRPWSYQPWWTLEMVLGQLGVIGPLFALAWWTVWRRPAAGDPQRLARLFLVWTAVPVFAFYLAVSLTTDIEANWPIAGSLSLVIIAAQADRARSWLWRSAIVYGVAAWIGLSFPQWLARVPAAGELVPLHRITAGRALAARVQAVRERLAPPPLLVAARYGDTALLAYYLPDRPRVFCARRALGGAATAYDYFADTDLVDPALQGRDAVLIGGRAERWTASLRFDRLEPVNTEKQVWIGRTYGGLTDD